MDKTKTSLRDPLTTHARRKGGNEINAPRYPWKDRPQTKPKRAMGKCTKADDAETRRKDKISDSIKKPETGYTNETTITTGEARASILPPRDATGLPAMCGQIDQKSRGGGTSAEEKIVNDLQKRIKNLDPTKPTHRVPEPDLRNDILSSLDQIHQLSRRNLFPGVGQSRCESWTKSVYNDNVHRLRFPETDEHKLRKNEFKRHTGQRDAKGDLRKSDELGLSASLLKPEDYSKLPTIFVKPDCEMDTKYGPQVKTEFPPTNLRPECGSLHGFGFQSMTLQPDIVKFPAKYNRDDEFWTFYDSAMRSRPFPPNT